MSTTEGRPGTHDGPPDGWDRLDEPGAGGRGPKAPAVEVREIRTAEDSVLPLIAGSWGDLALILGVAAATLVALKLGGHGAPFAAAPWAIGLAVAWWAVATATLVTVRRATPGMLMSGVRFARAVSPRRVAWVVAVALVLVVTLGIPTALGRRGWALGGAAGSAVISADEPS